MYSDSKTRTRILSFLIILGALLLTVPACHRQPQIPADVVAIVGSRQVTMGDFKRYLDRNAGTEMAQITAEANSALLDQYTEEILLSEYAATRGLAVPTERVAEAVRNDPGSTMIEKRDQLRREKLLSSLSTEVAEPTEDAMLNYYRSHPQEFQVGERIHVRQILAHSQEQAEKAMAELKKGTPFEEVSAQYSMAPNASHGGDIGFVTRGELPQVFEEVIFDLQAGELSGIISTDATWHIFKAEERLPAGVITFEQARPVIQAKLRRDAVSDSVTQTVVQARRELGVRILTRRLPFDYSGTFPRSSDE